MTVHQNFVSLATWGNLPLIKGVILVVPFSSSKHQVMVFWILIPCSGYGRILNYVTVHYTTLHHTKRHYITLHYIIHYTTLSYTTLHYTKLHHTILHCITLHYTTPHYMVL